MTLRAEAAAPADPRLRTAVVAVGLAAASLAAGALAVLGPKTALAVAAGGALAVGNLVALARIVGALLPADAGGARAQSRGGWALLAVLKMGALLGVVWLLMRQASLPPLAVLTGFGALPIGIAIGSLVSDRRPEP